MYKVALFTALFCPALVLAAAGLTPAGIAQDIDTRGARTVVGDLDQHQQLDEVFDNMSAGEKDWVMLAPKLAPGVDAAAGEGLSIVLAQALSINPQAVLFVATKEEGDAPLSIKAVCSAPFIEPSANDLKIYFGKVIPAVTAVNDPMLADRKGMCLSSLKQISDRVNSLPAQAASGEGE